MSISKTAKIAKTAIIYGDTVVIGENVTIDHGTIIYPNVNVGDNTFIGPNCIIGEPTKEYYANIEEYKFAHTYIGQQGIIRSHTIIYEKVKIGQKFQTGHHVTIREESTIGDNVSIGTLSDIQGQVNIGNYVRLHSNVHISQLTKIEDYVWIYPYVVTTNDKRPPHGILEGVTIKKFSQIATGAKIMPGVEIGENAFIGVGSVVTKNVDEFSLVLGNPAKEKGKITEIVDKNNKKLYPWKDYLIKNYGYSWQV